MTIFLLLGWVVCSAIGYLGKDSVYKNYSVDVKRTPYFVLVLDGIKDKVYPWSGEQEDIRGTNSGLAAEEPGDTGEAPENPAGDGAVPGGNAGMPDIPENAGNNAGTTPETPGNAGNNTETTPGTPETEAPENVMPPEPKQFVMVDESYFDDAVFIGDSRTVGLHDYSGLENTTFYATVGMNIYDLWTERFCEVDGEKLTLEEALTRKQFGKVYFQIGINEMGRGTLDGFMEQYVAAIEKFKELQPNAIIFLQGIMRVTKAKSDVDPIFNNANILARNERIRGLADGVKTYYIDVNDVVCDGEGNLNAELTFDNLHLYGSKYNIWVDFLKTKGVTP